MAVHTENPADGPHLRVRHTDQLKPHHARGLSLLGDPWQTVSAAAVPFWIHFAVQPALQALDAHLEHAEPYSDVHVFLFQHATSSPGIARPTEFAEAISRHGARAHFDGLDAERFPHDIGTLGRYGRVFDQLPRARQPWSPLPVEGVERPCGGWPIGNKF